MAEFPYLPLWTDAYLSDTFHLDDAQNGIYIKLLMLMWRTPGCRIPNDDAWLATRFKDIPAARQIIAEFCQSDGNWITQERLRFEHEQAKQRTLKQSVRAKARWNNKKTDAVAMPTKAKAILKEERKKVPAGAALNLFDLDQNHPEKPEQKGATDKEKPVNEPPRARLFREGKDLLVMMGVSPKQSGSIIGRWLKQNPDADGILACLTYAHQHAVHEPIGYVTQMLNTGGKGDGRYSRQTLVEIGRELADEARAREFAAGIGRPIDPKRSH